MIVRYILTFYLAQVFAFSVAFHLALNIYIYIFIYSNIYIYIYIISDNVFGHFTSHAELTYIVTCIQAFEMILYFGILGGI